MNRFSSAVLSVLFAATTMACGEAVAPRDAAATDASRDVAVEAAACEPEAFCSGSCRTLSYDTQNCGRCDHRCRRTGFAMCAQGNCYVIDVLPSEHFICAKFVGGAYECWGSNADHVIDSSDRLLVDQPEPADPRAELLAWAAGPRNLCVDDDLSGVRCRGPNEAGQNGGGNTSSNDEFVTGFTDASALAVGDQFACLLRMGTVYCWGRNDAGQLGDGTTVDRPSPAPVGGLTSVVQVVAGARHACARNAMNEVYCWGARGLVGDGSMDTDRLTPFLVRSRAFTVTAGKRHTCSADLAGAVSCWGANEHGQIGDGTTDPAPSPRGWRRGWSRRLTAGAAHTCAVISEGVRCWGSNASGELGDGTTMDHHDGTDVVGLPSPLELRAGGAHTCAVLFGGELRCWGENQHGELHDGTTINRTTPIRVLGI